MDLVTIALTILGIALIGFLVWLVVTYIPMADPFPKVVTVACVVLVVLYLLYLVTGHSAFTPHSLGGLH